MITLLRDFKDIKYGIELRFLPSVEFVLQRKLSPRMKKARGMVYL